MEYSNVQNIVQNRHWLVTYRWLASDWPVTDRALADQLVQTGQCLAIDRPAPSRSVGAELFKNASKSSQ